MTITVQGDPGGDAGFHPSPALERCARDEARNPAVLVGYSRRGTPWTRSAESSFSVAAW
jgi:hypothetical protein